MPDFIDELGPQIEVGLCSYTEEEVLLTRQIQAQQKQPQAAEKAV